MLKKRAVGKKENVKKWVKGDRKVIQTLANLPKYNMNQRGGVMMT